MKKSLLLIVLALAQTVHAQTQTFDIATVIPPKGWSPYQDDTVATFDFLRTNSEKYELCRIFLWASRPSTGSPAEDFENQWNERARSGRRIMGRPSLKTEKTPDGWTTVTGVLDSMMSISNKEQPGMTMLRTYSGFGKVFTAFAETTPNGCVREIDDFFRNLKLKTSAQDQTLILRYDEPRGFYRSAITPPDDYSAMQFNGSIQVYPFRRFTGDIQRMFTTTLLREWIDPRFQESNVAGRPDFRESRDGSLPGAQHVMMATFFENNFGIAKPHLRWVIVAGDAAALVDISASDDTTMRRGLLPLFDGWFRSLRVEAAPTVPQITTPRITQGPGSPGRTVAGLYMALVNYPRAFTTSNLAAYYYLLSAEGRVYRRYDDLSVPGGDPSRFDFDAAERADPVNSGRYSLEGNVLRIQMGAQRSETITTTAPVGGGFKIGSAYFELQ
jgi:hypothetical protein